MKQSPHALSIDSSGAHLDTEQDWHAARSERPSAVQADDDLDYFLRRPPALTPQPMPPAPARVTLRLSVHAPGAAATQATRLNRPHTACVQAAHFTR